MNDDDCEGVTGPAGDSSGVRGERAPDAADPPCVDGPSNGDDPSDADGLSGADGPSQADDRGSTTRTDGGVAARQDQREYLDAEVNIFRPSTPFMRDHLRIIWTGFAIWAVLVFGPVTLTAIAPDPMTTQLPVIGFPLHYFLVAIGAPGGALVLSIWYARKRDQLDEKYGIDHATVSEGPGGGPTAADGGTTGRSSDADATGVSGSQGSANDRSEGGDRE